MTTSPAGTIRSSGRLALEHILRILFAGPLFAAVFLTLNGLILLAGERLRRRTEQRVSADDAHRAAPGASEPAGASRAGMAVAESRQLETLAYREAAVIGLFQTLALLAGISRSGVTMVAGLLRGLDHEDAAKFSFLLATPVILAAGVLKQPTLAGPAGDGIHGRVVAGALAAGIAAYLPERFLTRYFTTRTLTRSGSTASSSVSAASSGSSRQARIGSLIERLLASPACSSTSSSACSCSPRTALFVGFVIPGETAAVLGGVDASRGHVDLWPIILGVVVAAIVGDTVGYEIGRHVGPRILQARMLRRHQRDSAKRRTS